MLVKDIMSTNIMIVRPWTLLTEVAEILHKNQLSGVPVVDSENTVLGLITEHELFTSDEKLYLPTYLNVLKETKFIIGGNKMLPYVAEQILRTTAKDIMNRRVFFTTPDMEVEKLALICAEKKVNPIPVVENMNKLIGIVSQSDLIKLLIPKDMVPFPIDANLEPANRPIDDEFSYVHQDIESHFAYVAKARANIWITTAIVLAVVGFIAGIIYTANPDVFVRSESQTISPH